MKLSMPQSRADNDEIDKSADITSVGTWLKTERESRNESLDRVASVTRIGKPYLEAIEEGDLTRLPGKAYIRGFIKLYAAHLGLSADEAIRLLEQRPQNQAIPVESISGTVAPYSPAPSPARPWLRYTLASLVIIPASAYAIFIYISGIESSPVKPAELAIVPPVKEQTAVVTSADKPVESKVQPVEKLFVEPTESTALKDGLVLRLKAVRDGKMQITIDNAVSQEYTLISGDLVEWKADRSFQIDLDNAAAVEAELDGKQLAPFGDSGKPAHLVITRNGVQKN